MYRLAVFRPQTKKLGIIPKSCSSKYGFKHENTTASCCRYHRLNGHSSPSLLSRNNPHPRRFFYFSNAQKSREVHCNFPAIRRRCRRHCLALLSEVNPTLSNSSRLNEAGFYLGYIKTQDLDYLWRFCKNFLFKLLFDP